VKIPVHEFCSQPFVVVTREEYNKICASLLVRCLSILVDALESSQRKKQDFEENIVAIGSSCQMPCIQQLLADCFEGVSVRYLTTSNILNATPRNPFENSDWLLLDVNSNAIGLEVTGIYLNVLIPRNVVIPRQATPNFQTINDNQPGFPLQVFEGNSRKITENTLLDTFEVSGIPPGPRGTQQIEISINVD